MFPGLENLHHWRESFKCYWIRHPRIVLPHTPQIQCQKDIIIRSFIWLWHTHFFSYATASGCQIRNSSHTGDRSVIQCYCALADVIHSSSGMHSCFVIQLVVLNTCCPRSLIYARRPEAGVFSFKYFWRCLWREDKEKWMPFPFSM